MSRPILLPEPRKLRLQAGVCHGETVSVTDESIPHEQGYRLSIGYEKIEINSRTPAGNFYAQQTLAQLRSQFGENLPCMEIEDWPDFAVRGVMLDISRDKVPTMQTLYELIDLLTSWKINQLQLYIEHTFAYSKHETVWKNASPITGEEIRALDLYCKERFIDLVPNQNSLGHMERWLKHAEYAPLAESIEGAQTPWGFFRKGPFSLCPTDARTLPFVADLYDELLPHFSSRLFNVGCDETYDIGQGRSKHECDRVGVHRVYLDFVRQINHLVRSRGRQMMFWGDVILHQPELIAELPADLIALQWGYEANHPFDLECEKFQSAGVPFYVCPGTSSWNSIAGRTENAINNLRAAAKNGLRFGAIGYLNTDWGDNGHLQYLPISYLGFAAGAAFSWCVESNRDLDFPAALNHHVFKDPAGLIGNALCQLGNVYRVCGKENVNGSALFRLLVPNPNDPTPEKGMTSAGFTAAESAIDLAIELLPTGSVLVDELHNAANMLRLCIAIGRQKLGLPAGRAVDREKIISEHRRLWLARNRPGGLQDSVKRLTDVG